MPGKIKSGGFSLSISRKNPLLIPDILRNDGAPHFNKLKARERERNPGRALAPAIGWHNTRKNRARECYTGNPDSVPSSVMTS